MYYTKGCAREDLRPIRNLNPTKIELTKRPCRVLFVFKSFSLKLANDTT